MRHGFLRAPDGTFTTFDADGRQHRRRRGTLAYAINPAGAITGFYHDATVCFTASCALLTAPSPRSTLPARARPLSRAPTPATSTRRGRSRETTLTGATCIHGFLRAPDGTITTFDAPGAGTGSGQGTFTATEEGLSPAGAIAGGYY